jgi:hypothetical protein
MGSKYLITPICSAKKTGYEAPLLLFLPSSFLGFLIFKYYSQRFVLESNFIATVIGEK